MTSETVLETDRTLDVGIDGMTCGSCAARVQKIARQAAGRVGRRGQLRDGSRPTSTSTTRSTSPTLQSAVDRAGYTLVVPEPADVDRLRVRCRRHDVRLVCRPDPEGAAAPGRRRRSPRSTSRPVAPSSSLGPGRDARHRSCSATQFAGPATTSPRSNATIVDGGPTAAERADQADADEAQAALDCGCGVPLIAAPIAAFMVSTMLYHDLAMENDVAAVAAVRASPSRSSSTSAGRSSSAPPDGPGTSRRTWTR